MKTKLLLPIILLLAFATTESFGQIPNNGFENWGTYNGFDNPTGWTGIIGKEDHGYSIQKNSESYPSGTGSSSILVQTDTPYYFGFARTDSRSYLSPGFPITGHPTSLMGYYKFFPQNGDTMLISVILWQSGAMVASATFSNTASVPSWTSFNAPISTYTTADSASIYLSSCSFPGGAPDPKGNSALYVDNLSFDNLITGIAAIDADKNKISVYPNPFFYETTLQIPSILKNPTLTVYNSFGQQVKQIKSISGEKVILFRDNLSSGLYFIRLTEDSKVITADKLVITD